MASASDHRAHAALQPADCLILLPQRLPAAAETSIGPAHYPAECTQSDAFLQPSLRARNGRANSTSFSSTQPFGAENLFVLSDGHRHFFRPGIGGGGHSQLVSVGIISPIAIPIILMVSWVAAGSYSAVNIYKNRHYIFNYFVVGGTSCQHFDLLYGTHAPQWQDPCPFCLPF